MSDTLHIIKPAEATSLVKNPQFWNNITDSWTSQDLGAGAVFARTGSLSYYGIGSAKITAGDGTAQLYSNTFTLANGATVYAQAMSYSTVATDNQLAIYDTTTPGTGATATGTLTFTWEELTCNWTNDTGGAVTVRIDLRNTGADGTAICYFDGVQAERSAETTYIDGEQPGCEWNGEAHNSTSTRSALSYQGGTEYDFHTDLGYDVGRVMGMSAPPVHNTFRNLPKSAGGMYDGTDVQGRPFTMFGTVKATSFADLHDKYHDLIDLFDVVGGDEVRLRYDGGTSEKWFNARYVAGLEGDRGFSLLQEKANIKMFASDPYFYQANDTNDVLDTNDTATLRYIARRKRSTGQWDDMGLTANPTSGGRVYAILKASDGNVYVGGGSVGWDGNAGWDYGVIYDPYADTFSRWGAANQFNGNIWDIIEGPDGTIYPMGAFTNCGDANGDGIVSYSPSAGTFTSLAAPGAGGSGTEIFEGAFDSDGNLHVVGGAENIGGVAEADGYAYWDGSAWATHGLPAVTGGDALYTIDIDVDDNIYVGGNKDNIAGLTYDNIAMWNGTAWVDVGIGLNGRVRKITIGNDGKTVYIGGDFTDAGGVTSADYITIWTGTQYTNLGTPSNGGVYKVKVAPNGDVWATGGFTTIGGYSAAEALGVWNGAKWTIPDINLPSTTTCESIEFANVDPTNNDNFDIYLGFLDTGAGYFAGSKTVTNDGNAAAYPTFILKRSGGTSAKLYSIRNETTGKQLYFHHGFPDGETLTIELSKDGATVMSDFLGPRRFAILANSDVKTFLLKSGDNNITCFVDVAGAPTITANCLHKARFTGQDD